MLSQRELKVVERHISETEEEGQRVKQGDHTWSVIKNGRLWVHNDTNRKQAFQDLYFYSVNSTVGTLTCSHPIKLWDKRRLLTTRETARLQGFPETFILPTRNCSMLLGNSVCVPCAAYAISRICERNDKIRHLDVCSGIGGFSFALRMVVNDPVNVGFSEVNLPAIDCYLSNFQDTPSLGDAYKVKNWPKCDLLTAGFPCQPFSCSNSQNRRLNHESKDFYKIVLHAIQCSDATRVVLENVKNFRTIGKDKFEDIIHTLKSLGFHVSFQILNSVNSGVPQQRQRLYIVASKTSLPRAWDRPFLKKTTIEKIMY